MKYLISAVLLLTASFAQAAFDSPMSFTCAQISMLETFEQIQNISALNWTPIRDHTTPSVGYSNKVMAIRIPKDCLSKLSDNFKKPIVSIRYPLSEIRIYRETSNGIILAKTVGEKSRNESDYPKSRSHHFSLEEIPDGKDLVIAAKSETSLQMPITFETIGELITHREIDSWVLAIHYGLLIMLGMFTLGIGAIRRDPLFFGMAALSFGLTFVMASMNWLPQTFIQDIPYFIRLRLVPFGGSFFLLGLPYFVVLAQKRVNDSSPFIRFYQALGFSSVLVFILTVAVPYRFSVLATHIAITFAFALLAIDIITFRFRTKPETAVNIAFLPLPAVIGLMSVSYKAMGLLPSIPIFNYLPQTGALVTVALVGGLAALVFIRSIRTEAIERQQVSEGRRLAAQAKLVAHDIRSPLAALQTIHEDLAYLPDDHRKLVRNAIHRISDIANELLASSKEANSHETENGISNILLFPLLDSVVTEVRSAAISRGKNILIDVETDATAAFVFSNINASEIKRALSNIITNAAEASSENGKVLVRLKADTTRAIIEVTDNGAGFPSHVLSSIGSEGVTTKENGNGLGLFQAKTAFNNSGGAIYAVNNPLNGATVTAVIPRKELPEDAIDSLKIRDGNKIIIVDDERSMTLAWKSKLGNQFEILSFLNPEEFCKWFEKTSPVLKTTTFLIDFDLGSTNGLELISKYNIAEHSTLVTSYYDEPAIRMSAKTLGVKVLPKQVLAFLPVVKISNPIDKKTKIVVLDDDPIILASWQIFFSENGFEIAVFEKVNDLLESLSKIELDVPMFIDVNLKSDLSGIEIAKLLIGRGFLNVNLMTGYSRSEIPAIPGLKQIVGKKPNVEILGVLS